LALKDKVSAEGQAAPCALHCPVVDLAGHVRCCHLDHRDVGLGNLASDRVHPVGRMQCQQARLVDQDPGIGDTLNNDTLFGKRLAKGHAALDPQAHRLESALRKSDKPHAMVDPARTEPRLSDLEAAPFT
jgi:hypothetical protein